jgi:flavin-binding protein dodecin
MKMTRKGDDVNEHHVYKVVELVGSSPDGLESAIQDAIHRASETLHNLDWFEVREIRGYIREQQVGWYQVKMGVGFRIEEPADMARGE